MTYRGDWNTWHHRFLRMAREVSTWSKDPSTQTGAVIVRPDRSIASVGYNGFPRGVGDTYDRLNDRPTKYALTVHAEVNAVMAAREPLDGCTAYVWPWPPCAPCAGVVIQAGIKRVYSVEATDEQKERWGDSFFHMETMFREAGVSLAVVPERWVGRLSLERYLHDAVFSARELRTNVKQALRRAEIEATPLPDKPLGEDNNDEWTHWAVDQGRINVIKSLGEQVAGIQTVLNSLHNAERPGRDRT